MRTHFVSAILSLAAAYTSPDTPPQGYAWSETQCNWQSVSNVLTTDTYTNWDGSHFLPSQMVYNNPSTADPFGSADETWVNINEAYSVSGTSSFSCSSVNTGTSILNIGTNGTWPQRTPIQWTNPWTWKNINDYNSYRAFGFASVVIEYSGLLYIVAQGGRYASCSGSFQSNTYTMVWSVSGGNWLQYYNKDDNGLTSNIPSNCLLHTATSYETYMVLNCNTNLGNDIWVANFAPVLSGSTSNIKWVKPYILADTQLPAIGGGRMVLIDSETFVWMPQTSQGVLRTLSGWATYWEQRMAYRADNTKPDAKVLKFQNLPNSNISAMIQTTNFANFRMFLAEKTLIVYDSLRQANASVWMYDLASQTGFRPNTNDVNMPSARRLVRAAMTGDRLYVANGVSSTGSALYDSNIYYLNCSGYVPQADQTKVVNQGVTGTSSLNSINWTNKVFGDGRVYGNILAGFFTAILAVGIYVLIKSGALSQYLPSGMGSSGKSADGPSGKKDTQATGFYAM